MTRTAAVDTPLRDPAFQRLWLGLSISYLGDQFTISALLWFVLQLTGSGAAVGLVILCFDLPGVVTGAILGRLLDRYQRSSSPTMIAVFWGALLCPLFFVRQLPLAMLFLGVAGASWAPYMPMETTLLQRLVPPHMRGQVFGARHSLVGAATPLGAAFGGVLLQYLSAPLVIAISGLACILAGLGGLVSPSLRQLQRDSRVVRPTV